MMRGFLYIAIYWMFILFCKLVKIQNKFYQIDFYHEQFFLKKVDIDLFIFLRNFAPRLMKNTLTGCENMLKSSLKLKHLKFLNPPQQVAPPIYNILYGHSQH